MNILPYLEKYPTTIHSLTIWLETYEERYERYSLKVKELNTLRKNIKMLYCGNNKGIGEPMKRIKEELTFAYSQISESKKAMLELRRKIEELEGE